MAALNVRKKSGEVDGIGWPDHETFGTTIEPLRVVEFGILHPVLNPVHRRLLELLLVGIQRQRDSPDFAHQVGSGSDVECPLDPGWVWDEAC